MRRSRLALVWMAGLVSAVLRAVDSHPKGILGTASYGQRCASCHGPEPEALARKSLKLEGAEVMLSRSGAPLREFLEGHGRANGSERDDLHAMFLRLLSTP